MRNTVCSVLAPLLLAASVLLAPGCRKAYVFPYPLRVTAEKVELNMYAGESHILVYSNTSWTASLVGDVVWGELVGDGGTGVGDVTFVFNDNPSIPRMARLALAAGQVRDTVTLVQSGAITSPSFYFTESIVNFESGAGEYPVLLETDVPDLQDIVKASAVYYFEGEALPEVEIGKSVPGFPVENWIRSIRFEDGRVLLNVSANNEGRRRSADFILLLDNGLGISYRISVRIRQNA